MWMWFGFTRVCRLCILAHDACRCSLRWFDRLVPFVLCRGSGRGAAKPVFVLQSATAVPEFFKTKVSAIGQLISLWRRYVLLLQVSIARTLNSRMSPTFWMWGVLL